MCGIIRETCEAIWQCLQSEFVTPTSEHEWELVSRQFYQLWNFPNCLGAIDGKHVVIQGSANSGSAFLTTNTVTPSFSWLYVDATYKFIYVDVGGAGRHSDGGILMNSTFGRALDGMLLGLPQPCKTWGDTALPYVFVGDEAFPLKENMMRPYPGKNLPEKEVIFNYRLSRARRIVENSFGILAARWRVFRGLLIADPDKTTIVTQAAIALHNYLRTTDCSLYCPPGMIDSEDGAGRVVQGTWRGEGRVDGLHGLGSVAGNRYKKSAAEVRDTFRDYFVSPEGEIDWQYAMVKRTD